MRAPGGTVLGYPKGVFLLAFTELWERFSYYGMASLLVLFLTEAVANHGFGWERGDALRLYGFYTGCIFAGPLLGAWLANSFWGERRCILLGGVLLVLGHACLGGPALIPWLAQNFFASDVRSVWVSAGVQLGTLRLDATSLEHLASAARTAGVSETSVVLAHRLVTIAFGAGLGLIAAGTSLLKPAVSSVVGRFFDTRDPKRDGAFALFFVGIYFGGLMATFVVGYLGERVAWHYGFTAAGIGMTIGLVAYLLRQRAWLDDIGRQPVGAIEAERRALTAEERDRIKLILLQCLFTVVYAVAFYQKGGLLTLFAREQLDRHVGGWQIPVTWFLTISTGTFILVTPLLARVWDKLAARNANPHAIVKLAWGLGAIGVGYVIIAMATMSAEANQSIWWGWLFATYLCFGVGDALVWPTQIAMVSRLAPQRYSALFVGGWYLTIGVGSWLTGYVGALGYTLGMQQVFFGLAIAASVCGGLLWALSPRALRLAHGVP